MLLTDDFGARARRGGRNFARAGLSVPSVKILCLELRFEGERGRWLRNWTGIGIGGEEKVRREASGSGGMNWGRCDKVNKGREMLDWLWKVRIGMEEEINVYA